MVKFAMYFPTRFDHFDEHNDDLDTSGSGGGNSALSFSQCTKKNEDDGSWMEFNNNVFFFSKNCPPMTYDEAQNLCMKLGMKPVSMTMSRPNMELILKMANQVPQGFWTNGWIQPEKYVLKKSCTVSKNVTFWRMVLA